MESSAHSGDTGSGFGVSMTVHRLLQQDYLFYTLGFSFVKFISNILSSVCLGHLLLDKIEQSKSPLLKHLFNLVKTGS